MFILKSCNRCQGDLGQDRDGEFTCLQCGHELGQIEKATLLARIRLVRAGLNVERQPELALAS